MRNENKDNFGLSNKNTIDSEKNIKKRKSPSTEDIQTKLDEVNKKIKEKFSKVITNPFETIPIENIPLGKTNLPNKNKKIDNLMKQVAEQKRNNLILQEKLKKVEEIYQRESGEYKKQIEGLNNIIILFKEKLTKQTQINSTLQKQLNKKVYPKKQTSGSGQGTKRHDKASPYSSKLGGIFKNSSSLAADANEIMDPLKIK